MDIGPGDIELLIKVGVGLVVALVALAVGRRVAHHYATREEREIDEQLKTAIAAGNLRRAGDIQVRRGLYREASRVYERGGEFVLAGRALERLGGDDKAAAEFFQKGGDHAKAAALFRKAGDQLRAAQCLEASAAKPDRLQAAECYLSAGSHAKAAKLFQEAEDYERAAEAFLKVDPLESPDQVLAMIENAALKRSTEDAQRKRRWRLAGDIAVKIGAHAKAARAFDEAGELRRAAELYEQPLKEFALAAAIYAEIGDAAAEQRLTLQAGGPDAVLAVRKERARARGDQELTLTLGAKIAELNVGELKVNELKVGEIGRPDAPRQLAHDETIRFGPGTAKGPPTAGYTPATAVPPQIIALAAPMVSPPAPREDRFELLAELGRGGMGVVHKARDKRLGRLVALKFLPQDLEDNAALVRLFHREARAAAALTHPGIVTVYDVGSLDNREFIAMELVDGTTLADALEKKGPLPPSEAFDVMERVLEAVHYAHQKGVIHRDLKPHNIMRTASGIKVMDFGLAKVVGSRTSAGGTVVGGTPGYMPAEQLAGNADHRSDIFALGATFYELLTGKLPGHDREPASTATGYPSVRDRVPSVPPRLSDLISRCLEHDTTLRPQDVFGVLRELKEIRSELALLSEHLRRYTHGTEAQVSSQDRPRVVEVLKSGVKRDR